MAGLRGPRGSIFALDSAPNDGLLAVGGYGAWGSNGDILLVNPNDGHLVRFLEGHRHTVCTLASPPMETRLRQSTRPARPDFGSGPIGHRKPFTVMRRKTYDADRAKRIEELPHIRPAVTLAASGSSFPC